MAKLTGKNAQIADEITAVLKKHSISLRSYRVSIGIGGEFSISMKCQDTKATDGDGEKTSPQREAYKRYASSYGYKPEWLGVEFIHNGRLFILEGFNMGKPKNFISMIEKSTGKRYMCPEGDVKMKLMTATLKKPA
jgi:hypothetical protein